MLVSVTLPVVFSDVIVYNLVISQGLTVNENGVSSEYTADVFCFAISCIVWDVWNSLFSFLLSTMRNPVFIPAMLVTIPPVVLTDVRSVFDTILGW